MGVSRDTFGISSSYGLKIGIGKDQLSNNGGSSDLSTSELSEYSNSDFFYDEGSSLSEIMKNLSTYIDYPEQEIPGPLITLYHRFFMIISLKGCLFSMVQTILNWKTSHNSFEKISLCLKIVVDEILKILNKKEDNDKHKLFIREVATDFFATLLDDANQYLVKRYKQEISDMFFHDNFFQMSRRNLRKWCKIINHFINDHKDAVFDDLLYKWNTQAGLLTSKDTENKQKIIALKRVSFLVFSGNVD